MKMDVQILHRENKNSPWKKWFPASLLIRDSDSYLLNVFLKVGEGIMWIEQRVWSVEEAIGLVREYGKQENFLAVELGKIE